VCITNYFHFVISLFYFSDLIIDFKVLVLSLLTLLADHTAVSTHRFPFCGCQVAWWHVGSVSDFRLICHGFESRLGTIVQWPWASYLHLCASVTKQYNLVPVKGWLPCDWGVQTRLWSVCEWQVKLCDSPITHGPCLTSRCCPA